MHLSVNNISRIDEAQKETAGLVVSILQGKQVSVLDWHEFQKKNLFYQKDFSAIITPYLKKS